MATAKRTDLCGIRSAPRFTQGPMHHRASAINVRRKMDLFLLVFIYVIALTVRYPGPMSIVFALVVLKVIFSWARSRRY